MPANLAERFSLPQALTLTRSILNRPSPQTSTEIPSPKEQLDQLAVTQDAERARRIVASGVIYPSETENARTEVIYRIINRFSSPGDPADERIAAYKSAYKSAQRRTVGELNDGVRETAIAKLEEYGLICRLDSRPASPLNPSQK
jgi:hypothetical protein